MQYLVSNVISQKIQLKTIITLSNASSPHKGTLSLKTGLTGGYSWGSSHVPDPSAQELDTQRL